MNVDEIPSFSLPYLWPYVLHSVSHPLLTIATWAIHPTEHKRATTVKATPACPVLFPGRLPIVSEHMYLK